MTRIILLRSCATDFDEEGRIKGTLDIPLSVSGMQQATKAADELAGSQVGCVYHSPYQAATETARIVADKLGVRAKLLKNLLNLDHGLWQGMLIEELKEKQKKVYRQWQEQPETVCPPGGETIASVLLRIKTTLDRLIKKHNNQTVVLVAPEPLTSLMKSYLEQSEIGDLWETFHDCGSWNVVEVEPRQLSAMAANLT